MSFSFASGSASRKGLHGGLAKAPAALMWPLLVVFGDPRIKVGLQLIDRAIDLFAKLHPIEFVEYGAMEALLDSIIRHADLGVLGVCPILRERVMVSPSGTRGAGSTKVGQAADRPWAASPSSLHGPPFDWPGCVASADQ